MIDRLAQKQEAKALLRGAHVSPYLFTLVVLLITSTLNSIDAYTSGSLVAKMQYYYPEVPIPAFLLTASSIPSWVPTFVGIMVFLLSAVLEAGVTLYHLGIRQGREMPLSCLFDGFGQVGRVVVLILLERIFTLLWLFLFIIPGIVASYRYSFALYNLLENPELSPMEAIRMSKAQTYGYKMDLFLLQLTFFGWYFLAILTGGLLLIWVNPYFTQTYLGYFQAIKRIKGIGYLPERENAPRDPDPFGPSF